MAPVSQLVTGLQAYIPDSHILFHKRPIPLRSPFHELPGLPYRCDLTATFHRQTLAQNGRHVPAIQLRAARGQVVKGFSEYGVGMPARSRTSPRQKFNRWQQQAFRRLRPRQTLPGQSPAPLKALRPPTSLGRIRARRPGFPARPVPMQCQLTGG